jgi:hypothetical protein
MTIPDDPENRWWVECSGANPDRVNSLRPALIAFAAYNRDLEAQFIGSGFIAAGTPDYALVITAKHVLVDGVVRHQRPHPSHAASALFVPKKSNLPSISPDRLKAAWIGSEHAGLMNVAHIAFNDSLDIATCMITPQELEPPPFTPMSLPLDTERPQVGEIVHMISHDNLRIAELEPPEDRSGRGQLIEIEKRISLRVGVVTNSYPKGVRGFKWPCFTTSIPAEPGMSGGLVFLPRDGKTISACGIVCADNSPPGAKVDPMQCGESIVACAWPALTLPIPNSLPAGPDTPTRSLYEAMRDGIIPLAVGGIDQIKFEDLGNGDFRIGYIDDSKENS